MKNTHSALFTVGILAGGAMMFALAGFLSMPRVSNAETAPPTSTPERYPYLVALEPSPAPRSAIPPQVTRTRKPASATAVNSGPTPFVKYGRLNHNGVDLNRNFPVNWKKDWDRDGCWNYLPTSGGTESGSEAETQALTFFINGHNIEVLISYHSAALGVFPGGSPWESDSIQLARSIAEATSYAFPPIDTGCTYSGTLADYAVSAGIAAVDLELTNHYDSDFDQNLNVLDILLNFVP